MHYRVAKNRPKKLCSDKNCATCRAISSISCAGNLVIIAPIKPSFHSPSVQGVATKVLNIEVVATCQRPVIDFHSPQDRKRRPLSSSQSAYFQHVYSILIGFSCLVANARFWKLKFFNFQKRSLLLEKAQIFHAMFTFHDVNELFKETLVATPCTLGEWKLGLRWQFPQKTAFILKNVRFLLSVLH